MDTKWGNPFTVKEYGREPCVRMHEESVNTPEMHAEIRRELCGKHLACWCGLNELCHADTLLRIANSDSTVDDIYGKPSPVDDLDRFTAARNAMAKVEVPARRK